MFLATGIDDTEFTSKLMREEGGCPCGLGKRQSNHKSGVHKIYESATDKDERGLPNILRSEPLRGYTERNTCITFS